MNCNMKESKVIFGNVSFLKLKSLLDNNDNVLLICTNRGLNAIKENFNITQISKYDQLNYECIKSEYPSIDSMTTLFKKYKNKSIKNIIAFGGGSVIDTAKILIYMLCAKHGNLKTILKNKILPSFQNKPYFLAIPTTAGTGSEVTQFATVWDSQHKLKYSISHDRLKPDTALIDSTHLVDLPKEIFYTTFLDALNQCFESFWNKNSTEKSVKYSTRGITHGMSIMKNHPKIDNKKLALMSLYSGLSISITKTGICHSISYPLTSHYKIPHGIACMFSFIEVLLHNIKNDDGRFSRHFTNNNSLVNTFENFFNRISFTKKINHLASKEELLLLKDKIFDPDRMNNNFKQLSKDEIVNIYLKSINRIF